MTVQLDIEKTYQGEYWTNRYFLTAESIEAAADATADIVEVEKNLHVTGVVLTKYRLSDATPDTDVYTTVPLNANATGQTGEPLPLFNVVRVNLTPQTGRPGVKMYRAALIEGTITGGNIDAAEIANIVLKLNALPLGGSGVVICDALGEPYLGITVNPRVSMRQLRRGTRRRTTPVLP